MCSSTSAVDGILTVALLHWRTPTLDEVVSGLVCVRRSCGAESSTCLQNCFRGAWLRHLKRSNIVSCRAAGRQEIRSERSEREETLVAMPWSSEGAALQQSGDARGVPDMLRAYQALATSQAIDVRQCRVTQRPTWHRARASSCADRPSELQHGRRGCSRLVVLAMMASVSGRASSWIGAACHAHLRCMCLASVHIRSLARPKSDELGPASRGHTHHHRTQNDGHGMCGAAGVCIAEARPEGQEPKGPGDPHGGSQCPP